MRKGSLAYQAVTFCYAVPAAAALIVIGRVVLLALRGLGILLGGG